MITKKQLIINADDFGMSESINLAVLDAYKNGILTSASLLANGPAFEHSISLLKEMQGIGLAVHLNIIEFSTLQKNIKQDSLLYDRNGRYNNGFVKLLLKSFNHDILKEVEEDFRLQIEKVLAYTPVDHIDSHVHVHAIPNIFKIVCRLAKEYGIKNIRTQFEYPYFVPDIKKYLSLKYPVNLIKVMILNTFTLINRQVIDKDYFSTNENIIGVNYTGCMDTATISAALKNVREKTELLVHPCIDSSMHSRIFEYQAIVDEGLRQQIADCDIDLINFAGKLKFI